MPTVYIIAGPNGVGKTTFAVEFLPRYGCKNFVNADLMARGISPLHPEVAAFKAGRLVLEQIQEYASRGEDFGFETTLSGRAYVKTVHDLKSRGYAVRLFFLWLPKVDLALSRIKRRVREGGHDVPEDVARRRYGRSVRNFFENYRDVVHSWEVFDNSGPQALQIAAGAGTEIVVSDEVAWKNFSRWL